MKNKIKCWIATQGIRILDYMSVTYGVDIENEQRTELIVLRKKLLKIISDSQGLLV